MLGFLSSLALRNIESLTFLRTGRPEKLVLFYC